PGHVSLGTGSSQIRTRTWSPLTKLIYKSSFLPALEPLIVSIQSHTPMTLASACDLQGRGQTGAAMEKMFVYPETLDSRVTRDMHRDDVESAYSRTDVASHRCKLYSTLLEQRTASRKAPLAGMDHEGTAQGAYA